MMESPAQPLRQNRFAWLRPLRARPWTSQLFATLGVVIMTIGLYVPIAGRDVLIGDDTIHYQDVWTIGDAVRAPMASLYMGGRAPLYMSLGLDAINAMLTFGGLALIPLLWRSFSPKGTVALRWTYAVWLTLLTLLAVVGFPAWWQFMSLPPTSLADRPVTLAASYLLPGAVVFPLGVLVGYVALLLILKEPLPTSAPAPAPRTGWQWGASLALTIGALVWGIGFYLMPEAVTSACPPIIFSVTQFAHGVCAGLDSDQMRTAARYAGLNPVTFFFDRLTWNYELMVVAAGITALGGWTRQLSVATLAWLAAWPVLALGAALVALQGVGAVAQQGLRLTVASGADWHIGSGMVVTFIGIGLVVLGQLSLWRELVMLRATTARTR